MNPQPFEIAWLDGRETIGLSDLSRACGLDTDELIELVDYGALVPLDADPHGQVFSAECVVQLRTAGKLRLDFDLDVFTVAILMGYLSRIDALERHVRSLEAHLPTHVRMSHRDGPAHWHEPHA